ncbi:hypothetical protein MNBD_BACTEROID03-2751 [hydrothermal vent metagenome]|uniref:TIR domain-containing protein n=1 Tax=hydrothermal vent metagenome TaxID=652676 RepID=A0A3B0TBI1_9ZZZZ
MNRKTTIYVIYTWENNDVMLQLSRHLEALEEAFGLTIWHDDPILTGQQWKPQNESRFNQADIFLLLVSDAFMHSEFIKQLEFKMVIDRYKAGKSTVLPLILNECPWDIDFDSDDYNFNLNELHVFPEGRKPLSDWDSPDQAYNQIAAHIKKVVAPTSEDPTKEESNITPEEKATNTEKEAQIAINFSKEGAKAKKNAEEEKKIRKEAEAMANRKATEEKRLKEEAEAKKSAEEENRLKKEKKAKREAEAAQQARIAAEANQKARETPQKEYTAKKKRMLIGLLVAVLATAAIWTFSRLNNNNSKKESTPIVATDTIAVKDSITSQKSVIDPPKKEAPVSKLAIGDTYDGGIVFVVDPSGKTGKTAHIDDAGPMTWTDAIKIHEELGEGWRLPSFDELRIMYQTIGQGATNKGEFADKLYWSATAYDEYQARLISFRKSNTSYHYNKNAEHRKFRVRAIRDFSR